MNACYACHAALSIAVAESVGVDLIQSFIGAPVREQVCHALNTVNEMSVQVCAEGDGLFGGTSAECLRQRWKGNAEAEEKDQENRSKYRVEGGEKYRGEESNENRSQRRGYNSHVEIFQCFHVANDAREQIASAEFHQAGGGEGFEFFVEPDAQAREQTEGDIVRNQPFEITKNSARDTEEAHADYRNTEVCHRWMKRRSGNKPSGCAHERHAGADGTRADQDRECDAMPVAVEEGEEAGEDGWGSNEG